MRSALILLLALAAAVVAEFGEEHWVEEEELDEPYNEEDYRHERKTRAADEEEETVPDCHKRVRRDATAEPERSRRPRRVHQYEVHEYHEEGARPAAPYEEMLAASADHYHRVYAAPPAPAPRRAKSTTISGAPGAHVPSLNSAQFAAAPAALASFQKASLNVANPVHVVNFASESGSGPVALAAASGLASVPGAGGPTPRRLADDQLGAAGAAGHRQQLRDDGWIAQGGGHANKGRRYNERGGKTSKGFDSDHHVDKGAKGFKKDEKHRKEYEEAAGKKSKHHDRAAHSGDHEEEAFGHRGSNFAEKKGHKKGHKTKGFHNKYHKDEFKKEHKFYDDFHKSGEHHRFGKFNAKHASNESGKKRAHHLNAGHDFVEHGKKGYSNKGHIDADHKGYNGKNGHEEHHENHSQYGKKGGRAGGRSWGHDTKN
ncbi:hypothetical protein RR48_02679 [Papilio machaon]|uniref:Uncharacterized protein n=1 Tax=Papilio machaon TaxID=76193 RepID=A0A0N1PH45_PAPMA|nr:hypothetical protein RR48_02679 [Papilio machaon]